MASSGDGLFHVDVIVLDEVHYLSDMYRGTVWEEIVSAVCCQDTPFTASNAAVVFSHRILSYISGYILPEKSSTHMFVSNSRKPR